MSSGAGRYGWGTVIMAACRAIYSGLAWRLSPTDPYGSLVDEAIRRAEEGDVPTVPETET
jgi:hypothetical protein